MLFVRRPLVACEAVPGLHTITWMLQTYDNTKKTNVWMITAKGMKSIYTFDAAAMIKPS